jgi:putative transposase
MDDYESLSHSKWECKYHVVFIPKCRRRTLYVELRRHLGEVFRRLAEQKESRIEEGHLLADHVHMLISIPPKYAVSQVTMAWSNCSSERRESGFVCSTLCSRGTHG